MKQKQQDHFIFTPGVWLGQGTISFSMSAEQLSFNMRWIINKEADNIIVVTQEIDVHDVPEKMLNTFSFSEIEDSKFSVNLKNDILGSVHGTGVIDEKVLAWEFRGNNQEFEGFEVFEKQEDGVYLTKAEYTSKDQMRTMIEGSIWQKAEE